MLENINIYLNEIINFITKYHIDNFLFWLLLVCVSLIVLIPFIGEICTYFSYDISNIKNKNKVTSCRTCNCCNINNNQFQCEFTQAIPCNFSLEERKEKDMPCYDGKTFYSTYKKMLIDLIKETQNGIEYRGLSISKLEMILKKHFNELNKDEQKSYFLIIDKIIQEKIEYEATDIFYIPSKVSTVIIAAVKLKHLFIDSEIIDEEYFELVKQYDYVSDEDFIDFYYKDIFSQCLNFTPCSNIDNKLFIFHKGQTIEHSFFSNNSGVVFLTTPLLFIIL